MLSSVAKFCVCCEMVQFRGRGHWRRTFGLALLSVFFVFLGYQSVVVTRSTGLYSAYKRKPPTKHIEAPAEEVRGDVSLEGERQPPEVTQPPAGPLVVLVLSSSPRGGSTLLTDLLSAVQGSVVVFEPLWLIEKTKCFHDMACINQYLSDVLSCRFTSDFEDWLKSKNLFFHFFSPEARRCLLLGVPAKKQACLKAMDLRERCRSAPVVVVKVIRARLAWMMKFLEDPHLNLKVIHLTRDPRGSINSISRFGWNADPYLRCSDLQDDMQIYKKLRQVFPSTVTQVHYEQLCLRPLETTKDILSFLFGNATLPASIRDFVEQHMLNSKGNGGNMSTFKNSTAEFEAWRYKISEKWLKAIEAEPVCVQAIKGMKHTLFGSISAANDSKIPLILNT